KNDGPGYLYADEVCLYGPDLTSSPGSTTYYVDAVLGADANAGTGPGAAAWKTLGKVNSVVFAPGDEILFRAGRVWVGMLD
ncbi:MAG: hypothetical protein GTN78_05275, partial [Gemmatimonadales bacterium]|nr:hypothetical protein [Gemmatimonadales bacterium]